MRNSDLTPYRRSTVGFDRLFDLLENQAAADAGDGFPPFDLEREGEDSYRITVAAAGFGPNEIEIVAQQNLLTIKGNKAPERADRSFLHRGIATRSFERRFQLAHLVSNCEATTISYLLPVR